VSDAGKVVPFLEALRVSLPAVGAPDPVGLHPAVTLTIDSSLWFDAASIARRSNARWCAFWASEHEQGFEAFGVFESAGQHVVLRTRIGLHDRLASHASIYPAADRPERHAHDLLGIGFAAAPDQRRWTRHQAWGAHEFPLRTGFHALPQATPFTRPDMTYPFARAKGRGVVEIPVGPVHAGIIEPGHFRFQAVGESVLNLEERLGYVHKGVEKLAVGRTPEGLVRLAARVSGDSTVAHAWAACQAIERATGIEVPPRAQWLRAIMAERERIANHLGDIGAICNDVGFVFAQAQLTRLKERFVRGSHAVFGHRFMMDRIVPGGVTVDMAPGMPGPMIEEVAQLEKQAADIVMMLEDSESLEDRLMTTGRLTPDQASRLGVVGYVGKASGCGFDVRRDAAYAPYDRFEFQVPVYRAGDVAARARVRSDEIASSLELIHQLLQSLPEGDIRGASDVPRREAEGIGMIEGWRGEILTYVRLGADGTAVRFYPRDPSWLLWPALELLIQDNIVPDFPVCNKSINASYSGHDL